MKLLILGGGSLNIKSILEARSKGFYTIVADKNPAAPSFAVADESLVVDLIDPQALYEAVKDKGIHGVVSMAEAGVRSAAKVSAMLGLPCISEDAAENATSKMRMRQRWATIPQHSVDFRIATTLDEARKAAEELNTFPLILKPDRTFGGSRGVSKILSMSELDEAFAFASSSGMNEFVVIEQCVEGEEFSCEVLINGQETSLLCVGQKVKSPLPYRVDLSVQYNAAFSEDMFRQVADMCDKAIKALGIERGVAHIEFAVTATGPRLFELGARCGGGHTPMIAKHVSGVSEFISYCELMCGLTPTQFYPVQRKGADYRFIVFPAGTLASVNIPGDIVKHPQVLDLVVDAKPGQTINHLRTTSDRAGAVVTLGETTEEAISLADEICSRIEVTYAGTEVKASALPLPRAYAEA